MDDPATPRVRPLPVSPATALLLGAGRWSFHMLWGAVALIVLAAALGVAAENAWIPGSVIGRVSRADLEALAGSLAGVALLLIPLPVFLAHVVLKAAGFAAVRRVAAAEAERGRPTVAERHALARVSVFGSADAWDRTRARWPALHDPPQAFSLAEDDKPLGRSRLSTLAYLVAVVGCAALIWGMLQVGGAEGLQAVIGDALTPLHLGAVGLAVACVLFLVEWARTLAKEVSKYRRFAEDPEDAARSRVQDGKDPDVTTACARAVLRPHPLPVLVAAPLTALGTMLAALPLTGLSVVITPKGTFTAEILVVLLLAAVPGIALALAGLAVFTRAAHTLPGHRAKILAAVPGLDPVTARGSQVPIGSKRAPWKGAFIVHGDGEGDPRVFEHDIDDSAR